MRTSFLFCLNKKIDFQRIERGTFINLHATRASNIGVESSFLMRIVNNACIVEYKKIENAVGSERVARRTPNAPGFASRINRRADTGNLNCARTHHRNRGCIIILSAIGRAPQTWPIWLAPSSVFLQATCLFPRALRTRVTKSSHQRGTNHRFPELRNPSARRPCRCPETRHPKSKRSLIRRPIYYLAPRDERDIITWRRLRLLCTFFLLFTFILQFGPASAERRCGQNWSWWISIFVCFFVTLWLTRCNFFFGTSHSLLLLCKLHRMGF